MLDDNGNGVLEDLSGEDNDVVTAQFVEDGQVVCWTCGSEVNSAQIQRTIDSLWSVRQEKLSETSDLDEEPSTLEKKLRSAKRQQQKCDRLEDRIDEVKNEIVRRRERVERLREKMEGLTDDIEDLETEVEALESEDFSGVLDLHKEANQLEFELER